VPDALSRPGKRSATVSNREVSVAHYRLYVVDHTGRVIAGDDAICLNDEVASDRARSMLCDGTSTEAWLGTRLVAQFVSPHGARRGNM
jgi:hypothetical protein